MVSFLQLVASILLLCHFGSRSAVDILFFPLCLLWLLFPTGYIRGVEGFFSFVL